MLDPRQPLTSETEPERCGELEVGRRLHGRLRVFLPGKLTSVHGTQPVQLHNISRGGVRLHWSQPVRAGADVVVAFGPYELFGTIVWSDRQFGGVALDVPLPEALILAIRAREAGNRASTSGDASAWYLENLRYDRGAKRL